MSFCANHPSLSLPRPLPFPSYLYQVEEGASGSQAPKSQHARKRPELRREGGRLFLSSFGTAAGLQAIRITSQLPTTFVVALVLREQICRQGAEHEGARTPNADRRRARHVCPARTHPDAVRAQEGRCQVGRRLPDLVAKTSYCAPTSA